MLSKRPSFSASVGGELLGCRSIPAHYDCMHPAIRAVSDVANRIRTVGINSLTGSDCLLLPRHHRPSSEQVFRLSHRSCPIELRFPSNWPLRHRRSNGDQRTLVRRREMSGMGSFVPLRACARRVHCSPSYGRIGRVTDILSLQVARQRCSPAWSFDTACVNSFCRFFNNARDVFAQETSLWPL
jgi:hypothetical protein